MQKNEQLLSIIVPVYNDEKYIEKCIQSILNQSYKNIELVIVDDGSTDNSFNICKRFSDKSSKIKLYKIINSGPGIARNFGIKHSSGELIAFVDGDDWVEINGYSGLINHLSSKVDIVFGKGLKIFQNSKKELIFNYFDDELILDSNTVIKKILCEEIGSQSVQFVMKRKCVELVEYPSGRYEDVSTIFKFFINCNDVFFSNVNFYRYQMNNFSISHTKKSQASFFLFEAFAKRLIFAKEHYPEIENYCVYLAAHYAITSVAKRSILKLIPSSYEINIKSFLCNNKTIILQNIRLFNFKVRVFIYCYFKLHFMFAFLSLFL